MTLLCKEKSLTQLQFQSKTATKAFFQGINLYSVLIYRKVDNVSVSLMLKVEDVIHVSRAIVT